MPQGMFQGWSYAQLGYCPSTFETTRLASTVGIFDATWYSPGSRRTIDPSLASGGTLQATSPVAITVEVRPSMYWMVITVNGRRGSPTQKWASPDGRAANARRRPLCPQRACQRTQTPAS
ncbi:MAG: hypothetical protein H6759_05435 [Candidatus Nomurabacteria bacterium]|nr:MAG: hypothetical protein H6759_05435 [Candidatus Nomurabacteria bacterium]